MALPSAGTHNPSGFHSYISRAGDNDLAVIGFRETVGGDDAYPVTGARLTRFGAATGWGKGDLVINGVEIYDANVLTNTAQKKVEAINNFSVETGVTASLTNRLVFDLSSKYAITNVSTGSVVINGIAAAIGSSISALVTNVNAVTATTGVTAEAKGG